ncbi:MAG: cyclic nucleotide-binding domain-containing protein [Alphaproteobacteria bacterium]|nr:cyclic nucleotide-binding domain-containing protein [Alphaproteobacteria bacterium]
MPFPDLLPEAPRRQLELMAEELRVAAGERLIKAGDRGGDIYRIVSGSLEVVDARGHPEVILDVLGPGSVVGEMGFLADEPRSADVRAFEPSRLLRWRSGPLRERLQQDPALARDFYRALAQVMASRLRSRNSYSVTLGEGPGAEQGSGARQLAEALKSELLRIEVPLRREDAGATRQLGQAWAGFLINGERLFQDLTDREKDRAGEVLRRELSPYLLRARTGELLLSGKVGDADALAHVERGVPKGGDPFGRALDRALLATPTALALRDRRDLLADAAAIRVVGDRPRKVAVLGCGSGAVPATLGKLLGAGSDMVCVDGDRRVLSDLDSATLSRDPELNLRLVHEDLATLAMGGSRLFLGERHLIVVHGLLEFLPDALVPDLLRWVSARLRVGGVALVETLLPTGDRFLFDHVLGWRMLRRSRPPVDALKAVSARGGAAVWALTSTGGTLSG